jgi:hypothetical protein
VTRPDALLTAHALTRQDRNGDYGTPRTNWQVTADIWTAMLTARGVLKPGAALTADMAALLMVGVKLARESFKHKPDNLVDAAGYIDVAERCLYGEEHIPNPPAVDTGD